ncbi:MAG TPA: hypothetical protein VLV84_02235 [Candidatus Acidoferrales bacterium]|nr:hypothetical protein [Candidatus Acidoferrales bacterium]
MMRTVEVLMVIIILTGAFMASTYFAVLPWPRQVSPLDLGRLSLTTLETLNSGNALSEAAFDTGNATDWENLQVALSASLPPNVIYNLTVYNVNSAQGGSTLYTSQQSISNAANLGISSDAASYLVSSSNVTFNPTPQKIGETASGGGGITLYILNCSDSNGWWITGYNAQSLAGDLENLLSPYFARTVMVQTTAQLGTILNGTPLDGETLQNAVVINTCGEAVPIPSAFSGSPYSNNGYAGYCYLLGQKVNQYNWTWTSIVGWPFYYVTNTALFSNSQNGWGIYGMNMVGPPGLNAFLEGIDNQPYTSASSTTGSPGVVNLSNEAITDCNYYGIYPSTYQTSTRALPTSILAQFHLTATTYVFNTVNGWNPGAVYRHTVTVNGKTQYQGGFYALGLARTPDIRLTALGLLCDYHPRIYSSDFNSYDTSRLAVLQLGLVGGT